MNSTFTESVVEQAALAWIESVGWSDRHGAEMAVSESVAGPSDYSAVLLAQLLRDTLLPKLISGELRVKDAERIAEIL